MLYLGTNEPVDRDPWEEGKSQSLYVSDLDPRVSIVVKHFSKPHICYVGAYEGCGCGFRSPYGEMGDDAPETVEAVLQSRERLAQLLRNVLEHETHAELYVCWADDEGEDAEYQREMSVEELLDLEMDFRERELITVMGAC